MLNSPRACTFKLSFESFDLSELDVWGEEQWHKKSFWLGLQPFAWLLWVRLKETAYAQPCMTQYVVQMDRPIRMLAMQDVLRYGNFIGFQLACKLKFRLWVLTSYLFSTAASAICFEGCLAGLDKIEPGNENSQPKF